MGDKINYYRITKLPGVNFVLSDDYKKLESKLKEKVEELEIEKGKGLEAKEWWWKNVEKTNIELQKLCKDLGTKLEIATEALENPEVHEHSEYCDTQSDDWPCVCHVRIVESALKKIKGE